MRKIWELLLIPKAPKVWKNLKQSDRAPLIFTYLFFVVVVIINHNSELSNICPTSKLLDMMPFILVHCALEIALCPSQSRVVNNSADNKVFFPLSRYTPLKGIYIQNRVEWWLYMGATSKFSGATLVPGDFTDGPQHSSSGPLSEAAKPLGTLLLHLFACKCLQTWNRTEKSTVI